MAFFKKRGNNVPDDTTECESAPTEENTAEDVASEDGESAPSASEEAKETDTAEKTEAIVPADAAGATAEVEAADAADAADADVASEATEAIEAADAAEATEAVKVVDAAEASDDTVAIQAADAADAAEAINAVEVTEAIEAASKDAASASESQPDQTVAIPATEATPSANLEEKVAKAKHAGAPVVDVVEDGQQGFVGGVFGEIPKHKSRKGLKAFGITVGVLAGIVLVAYVAISVVFLNRMMPNTVIGDFDVSLKTDEEVVELLDAAVGSYRLDIVGGGFSYRTTGDAINLTIDSQGIVDGIHDEMTAWAWPALMLSNPHDQSGLLRVDCQRSAYETELENAVKAFNETAEPPVNATIAYNEKKREFVVQPEVAGAQLNPEIVVSEASEAIAALSPKVSLGPDELIQPEVFSDDERLIESAKMATGLVSADLTLMLDGQEVGNVNGESLSRFISVDDKLAVVFDEEGLNDWIGEFSDGFNTVGTERTYTRPDGKTITVTGGSYGWEVDSEELASAILDGIREGSSGTIDIPCSETAYEYSGPGEPDWGDRYIDVDLSEQHARFYDGGSIIWETDVITGSPDGSHNTWPGVWYINNKENPSKLIGYENGKKIYETTVTYWMPFEGNGIGLHDASWQPSFGGSMYANGYGSHGCVNLPYSKAQELYDICEIGDVVIVHS